jgi:hypothetical protein
VLVAMIRVGIDTGSGGWHGPIFADGSFEYVPIPDGFGLDERTYRTIVGQRGASLADLLPRKVGRRLADRSVHLDPEFKTFTYGDPTPPKRGLRRLGEGDLLVFYAGLAGWDIPSDPALYLIGYFEVERAGLATEFSAADIGCLFEENFHVRHPAIFEAQRRELVLVKGGPASRLLTRARCLSEMGRDVRGRPLKVISAEMQQIFGSFDGHLSFQRSPTRWVSPAFVDGARTFLRSLP